MFTAQDILSEFVDASRAVNLSVYDQLSIELGAADGFMIWTPEDDRARWRAYQRERYALGKSTPMTPERKARNREAVMRYRATEKGRAARRAYYARKRDAGRASCE